MTDFADKFPPSAGQLTIDGQELVPVTNLERRLISQQRQNTTLCCDKALRLSPDTCVCLFQTTCPEHGRRHFGTHD